MCFWARLWIFFSEQSSVHMHTVRFKQYWNYELQPIFDALQSNFVITTIAFHEPVEGVKKQWWDVNVHPQLDRNREIAALGRVYRLVHSNPSFLSNVVVSDVDRFVQIVDGDQDSCDGVDDIV
jgi:hypothetical protein